MAQESKGEQCTEVDIAYLHGTPLVYTSSTGALEPVRMLDVTNDAKTVEQAIRGSNRSFTWKRSVATLSALIDVVGLGCVILHFTGHGSNSGFVSGQPSSQHAASRPSLAFESGENGVLYNVDADLLSDMLSDRNREAHGVRVMLVVIMACQSAGVAKTLVERGGCSHAVAIDAQQNVSDKDAMAFTEKFYEQLLSGHSIEYSFNAGLTNVDAGCVSGNRQFQLFNARGANPKKSKMPPRDKGVARDLSKHGVGPSVDGPTEFRGRRQDLFELTRAFFETQLKFVQIVGDAGMGKSSLAARFVRRVQQRQQWDVLWVDLHGVKQIFIVVQRIIKALRTTYSTYYDDLPEDTKVEENARASIEDVARNMEEHMWMQAPQALLLVLDGVEPSLVDQPALRHLITRMLGVPNSSLRLLITARQSVPQIVSFSHTVKGLSREDSAYLMSSIKPHDNIQIHGAGGDVDNVWNSIKDTQGNPGIIVAVSQRIFNGAILNDVVKQHLKATHEDVRDGKYRFQLHVAPSETSETPRETPGKPVASRYDTSRLERKDSQVLLSPDSTELIHQHWVVWQIDRRQAERLLGWFSPGDCLILHLEDHTTVSVKDQQSVYHYMLEPTQKGYVARVENKRTQEFATPEAFVEWHQKCRRIVVPLSDNKHPSHGAPLSKHTIDLLHGPLSRLEAEDILGKHEEEGTFLLRLSHNMEDAVVVSCWVVRETELKVQHFDVKYSGKWQLRLRDTQGTESVERHEDLAECIGPNLEWKRAVLVTGRVIEKDKLQDFVSEQKYDSVPVAMSPSSNHGVATSRASTDSMNSFSSQSVRQSSNDIYSPIGGKDDACSGGGIRRSASDNLYSPIGNGKRDQR